MKAKSVLFSMVAFCCFLTAYNPVFGQIGTAFTYQGRLSNSNSPAAGTYDLTFKLWTASSGGAQVGGTVSDSGIVVTGGLFTVVLDFGSQYTTGTAYWLELGVRTNGAVSFATLSPRQQLTPAPYAISAENVVGAVPAGQLTGILPPTLLSGLYVNPLDLNNPGNIFDGNGAGLTGVNALTLDGLGANNFWQLTGNAGTTAGLNFVGTADNQPLEVHVNGQRAFRVEPDGSGYVAPNVIGGSLNYDTNSAYGATIGGGGGTLGPNSVTASFGTIAGGVHNTSGQQATVGGGYLNTANAINATVGGGFDNNNTGAEGTVGGGYNNSVSGFVATVPGGYNDIASGDYSFAAGSDARATNSGSFVWSDHSVGLISDTGPNQFVVRATGGSYFYGGVNLEGNELYLEPPTSGGFANDGLVFGNGGLPGINLAGDGPWLAGFYGGSLGGLSPNTVCLSWDYSGDVWVSNNLSTASLTVRGDYLVVNGGTPLYAYIGDDGFGNDVQIGSQRSGITAVACYNTADNAYMHLYCSSITIEGGADLAEPFKISKGNDEVPQGAVVVIDRQNPGRLKMSDQAYDTHVAGVVSGANGISPGIQMQQQGILDGGKNVALTGRVYVQADASNGAIEPGDLLTTSSMPGDAMKVTDHARAAGAILGKAMTGLSEGKGMVLVLVTLQ
ncbi:MAG: hypothetical protein WAO02_04355 [Verrucomicrobiia bacterium]